MKELGVDAREIDIRPMANQMLADLDHPFAKDRQVYDITFENVQAGLHHYLFRLANKEGGLVVGTGDLSELALGWCTYGVGDHMSHYNVNASVAKTLIQHLIRWSAASGHYSAGAAKVMRAILDQEISPELVPPGADGRSSPPRMRSVPTTCTTSSLTRRSAGARRLRASPSSPINAWAMQSQANSLAHTTRRTRRLRPASSSSNGWRSLPALLPDQPVQALGRPERPEGDIRRLAFAARRLAHAQRFHSGPPQRTLPN